MQIAVIGQGYVGLTAATCLTEAGHRVTGVESDKARLDLLRQGGSPIYEPGLEEILASGRRSGRLDFRASISEIEHELDAVIIAVGSPEMPSGGADIRQVASAIAEVALLPRRPGLVMVKSTVPPGTSERLLAEAHSAEWLAERYVVSPEFLSLGSALKDWRQPSRVVVGLRNESLLPALHDLYRGIDAPWIVTGLTNAEMVKYASNAFLATKISFINEIANLCDEIGATVDDVVAGLAPDPRIGGSYLRAGVGYGGSCFPKDTRALSYLSSIRGHSMPLLEAVIAVNNAQPLRVVRALRDALQEPRQRVAVLGLAFKPGTDDTRQAPSLTVVPELMALGHEVVTWDPAVAPDFAERLFPGVGQTESLHEAVAGAHAAVILTEWTEVIEASWPDLLGTMRSPRLVVDGRNCLDPRRLETAGAVYRGIGRPAAVPSAERRLPMPTSEPSGVAPAMALSG